MAGTYTYEPEKVFESGKDRMRFELGDTMVEGGSQTSALTDEEITVAIEFHAGKWKKAKLMLLESIFRRFSYEVNTKTKDLSLELQERAKLWKEQYEQLKKEVKAESISVPRLSKTGEQTSPYFYAGMMANERRG